MKSSEQGASTEALGNSLPLRSPARGAPPRCGPWLKPWRPQQWVKNGFIFAALIFLRASRAGTGCRQVLLAALVFCVVFQRHVCPE